MFNSASCCSITATQDDMASSSSCCFTELQTSTSSLSTQTLITCHHQPTLGNIPSSTTHKDYGNSRNNITKHKPDMFNNVKGSFLSSVNGGKPEANTRKRVLGDRYSKNWLNSKSRDENLKGFMFNGRKKEKGFKMGDGNEAVKVEKMEMVGSRKKRVEGPGAILKAGLDMCSKRGDVIGAIRLYDAACREGVKMGEYHYAVLLYLCSSAATGVVQPAKSGSGGRSLGPGDSANKEIEVDGSETLGRNESSVKVISKELDMPEMEILSFNGYVAGHYPQTLEGLVQHMKDSTNNYKGKDLGGLQGVQGIQVSEDVKRFALHKGFEIYEKMQLENLPMNEATLTSVARLAMSLGDGDIAFDMVKQMKELQITPRLRSYGPALFVFCNNGEVDKAFLVENHMLEHGVYPEEPELEALLRVSVESGRSDKVYCLLHKLRTSVRQVSPSTADVIEKWFKSSVAARVGKRKWDERSITEAIENGGGGWHGQGWLGKGKWSVSGTSVGPDGVCRCCGEKLTTIDLDPVETEKFAKSVASLASQRERNSSFQKFQKWLDYHGPFEAVVDAANIGLHSPRKFKPSKVNAVVNGIRQMLHSKKWPLIVLHNRRITGDKMDEPFNKKLIEKWRTADALYATPTGSNDDWYWLYAAIKFKCLIVTNDEMRDHLFQLLGTDFFPKWKERHQVHFSFSEIGPVFHMPPPCSVVIQESEKGDWHIPVVSECDSEEERTWLCIMRTQSQVASQRSSNIHTRIPQGNKEYSKTSSQMITQVKLTRTKHGDQIDGRSGPHERHKNRKSILSAYVLVDHHPTILSVLDAAEKLGCCVIDFQI